MNRYAPWRDYVFGLLARRLSSVMAVVNEIAFRRMDARVAGLLHERARAAGRTLKLTHQDIAAQGIIETGRGTVIVLGTVDRVVRVVIAAVVGLLILTGQLTGVLAVILGVFSVVFVATSLFGFCPLYALFGISTCPRQVKQ